MDPVTIGVLAAVLLLFLFIVARQNTLFEISVRSGRTLVVRGRVPPGFLADVRAIVRGVPHASIRAVKDQGGAPLTASGVDANVLQRPRNAFSIYPAARLRAAPPIQRPTLGQILGIAWLAWLLERR